MDKGSVDPKTFIHTCGRTHKRGVKKERERESVAVNNDISAEFIQLNP